MKKRVLNILKVVTCLAICHSGDAFAAGKGGSNGGDYLLLMNYAQVAHMGDPIMKGILPVRNAKHYRYEFIRAARSGLRKMRSLLKTGRQFRYSDGTSVVFNETTLKKFSYRINDLAKTRVDQFTIVESITNSRGEPLTAQNYQDGRVELVPTRWDEMRQRSAREAGFNFQEAFAVHEVLGIDEIERSDEYPVASAVLNDSQNSESRELPDMQRIFASQCSRLTSISVDVSFNPRSMANAKPAEPRGIIAGVTNNCLAPTPELVLRLGNNFVNTERKTVSIAIDFSSDLEGNEFIKNPVMARQMYCAMSLLSNSDFLTSVELDKEDQFVDWSGKKVTTFNYSVLDENDRELVYRYYGFHRALSEAFQADQNNDEQGKAAALYHANTAIGEGLLTLDEALRLKPTSALYIKYRQRVYDQYAKIEYPRLVAEFNENQRLYEIYKKTGEHPNYGWFEKLMEKMSRASDGYFKPRSPLVPRPPAGDPFALLKACGYFNPPVQETTDTNSEINLETKTEE